MNITVIGLLVFFVVSAITLFLYFANARRINELKEKTSFAAKSDELVKVQMEGNDNAAAIALNFNVLGERLYKFKTSNSELSGIKEEKQTLDSKLKTFQNSLSQLNLLTDIGRQITSCLNVNDIAVRLFKNINSSMVAEEVNILITNGQKSNYYNVLNGKLEEIVNPKWCEDKDNILNWSYANNKEVFLNNASKDYAQYVFKPLTMQNEAIAESVISIPLAISNKMIGSVSVLCSTTNSYNEFHLDFVRSLASYVSVAIDNANLYGQLDDEKQKSENLLLNILPPEIAIELKENGRSEARQFNNVSVLFTDFVNFTGISEKLSPKELVTEIDRHFKAFDEITERNGLEKIKTIGDAYLAVCGLPNENINHARDVTKAAQEMLAFLKDSKSIFEMRIGVNSGPVIAGIVGSKKFAYDIWGDTVNTAARMEQNGEAGKINVSGATYNLIKDKFTCEYRGKINAKNKGEIDMYFVS
jgi:class 3 adenylate cyclase